MHQPPTTRASRYHTLLAACLLSTLCISAAPRALADQQDQRLPELFKTLATAEAQNEAYLAAQGIWAIWTESGDEQVDSLMLQGAILMGRGALQRATQLLNQVIELQPDYAEGWNRRATAHYLSGDFAASMADIRQTLILEPRHFGAISGMGLIFMATGDQQGALNAFEEVLRIHPWAPGARAHSQQLREKLGINL